MTDQSSTQAETQEEKFKKLFEKARKGVLKELDEKGGTCALDDMHEFSLKTYFIQHQRFSELMETLVENNYVDYDWEKQEATITDAGKEFHLKQD